jgi:endo-1,4-beta-xylanase
MNTHRNTCLLFIAAAFLSSFSYGSENILTNPGFETGNTSGWSTWSGSFVASSAESHAGNYSGLCTDRTEYWQGPVQSVLGKMIDGETYQCSAWVRIENAPNAEVSMNIAQTEGAETNYHVINRKMAYDNQWIQLSGEFILNVTGSLSQLDFYFNWPDANVNFYVDDAVVDGPWASENWKTEANVRIEQLRKSNIEIIVINDVNQPVSDVNVQINQIKKSFPFGCVMGQSLFKEPQFKTYFADIFKFNWAVFQNEAKWYYTEAYGRDYITYRDMNTMLDFCELKGINARGHLIFWPVEDMVQQWVKDLNDSDLWQAMQQRLDGVVTQALGRFKMWDVCSEMVSGTYFEDRLGDWVNTWMFQRTRELDPNVNILIDEYCVISCDGWHLEPYKTLISSLINDGAPINIVGVECYNMGEFNPDTIMARLDSMAEPGLPIWITQLRINETDVNLRAEKLEKVLRTAYSHPAVKGIMQWAFYEENEATPESCLIDKGWNINAAGQRYLDLMAEWETHDSNVTDANGLIKFRGFHGTYEITLTTPGSHAEVHTIELLDAPGTAQLTLKIGTGAPPDTNAPELDSMTWLSPPQAVSPDVILMTAPEANDISGVQYYFNNTTDPNHDSGWQESNFYADSGLLPNTNYTFRFKVRDKSTQQNETDFSNQTTVLTPPGGNILTNSGFEAASAVGWSAWGYDLTASKNQTHSGNYSGLTETRAQTWQGPIQDISDKVADGMTYECSAWLRLDNATSQPVAIIIKQVDDEGTNYYGIATGTAYNFQWVYLNGTFTLDVNGTLQNLSIFINGPAPGVNFYLDDLVVKTDPINCSEVRQFGFDMASDITGDCYVNLLDLEVLADFWLRTDCAGMDDCMNADFEPDGDVDFSDYSDFAADWLNCNNPQDSNCILNW